ncbi:hypothetical protein NA57DRAFT_47334 [Rhizodiscina lignyota]|uniref:Cation efflux protein transmembrane domain-containing protein n=1 Tax=Rhizodiscina lignyota TaxID=1504668 RepID=A0A9P4M404_9PEZI|nr:hypothetical protein NA57DRAFT_47334 [Rhizodiscina lignyota]
MVGKRQQTSGFGTSGFTDDLGNGTANGHANGDDKKLGQNDIEFGRPRPRIFKFRDAVDLAVEDERRDQLKNKLLQGVDRNEWEKFRKSDDEIKQIPNKGLRKFYKTQNERLNDWLEVDAVVTAIADDVFESFDPDRDQDGIPEREGTLQEVHEDVEALLPKEERDQRKKDDRKARLAININVIANILLLAAKIGAVFFSTSLSLIASLVDSALDLLCTIIVWTTNKLVSWRAKSLKRKFPVGRRRLEPLGILVFSIIMVISFIQVLQESFQKLLPAGDHSTTKLPNVAIFAMAATIGVKGLIGLGCLRIKTTQVQALVQDCKTDVYFNTLSLLFPLIGSLVDTWWLDPVGAAILSLFIIYDWSETCFQNVTRLSGSAVDDRLHEKLLFLAYRFSPVVDGFKNIVAYHCGDGIWVEVDILLPSDTSLISAHDIAETLQYCYEGLKDVDRAFVTVDYTTQGPTGHAAGSS